jgi:hypothetical protein
MSWLFTLIFPWAATFAVMLSLSKLVPLAFDMLRLTP